MSRRMTIDEALAKAGTELDRIFARAELEFEDSVKLRGFRGPELDALLDKVRQDNAKARATALKDLRRGLENWGAPSASLQ